MSLPDSADVRRAARAAGDNPWLERAARAGYATNGLVHALIAFIALRLAWGGGDDSADQSGALEQLGSTPLGAGALWVCVVGFGALALVLVAAALVQREWSDRAKSIGKAVTYSSLALLAGRFAAGGGDDTDSQETSVDATRTLMELPGGAVLVGVLGLAVVVVGGYHVHKGAAQGFLEDLVGDPGQAATWAGIAGYVAKGVALVLVGALFVWAAVTSNPQEATGLDGGLRALLEQPRGPWLLGIVALGLLAFAVYSVVRARKARL